jgi:hypothetical protein
MYNYAHEQAQKYSHTHEQVLVQKYMYSSVHEQVQLLSKGKNFPKYTINRSTYQLNHEYC